MNIKDCNDILPMIIMIKHFASGNQMIWCRIWCEGVYLKRSHDHNEHSVRC